MSSICGRRNCDPQALNHADRTRAWSGPSLKHRTAFVRKTRWRSEGTPTSGTWTPTESSSSRSFVFAKLGGLGGTSFRPISRPFCFSKFVWPPQSWPTTRTHALRSPSQRVQGPISSESNLPPRIAFALTNPLHNGPAHSHRLPAFSPSHSHSLHFFLSLTIVRYWVARSCIFVSRLA